MQQTFLKQKEEDNLKKGVNKDLTKIKVKKLVESEIEDISDLEVLSVKLEDSISCEPVRRSSRKRSASRASLESNMKENKTIDLVGIAIREPEDLILMNEALNSSANEEVIY